jgi:hypothetical protein
VLIGYDKQMKKKLAISIEILLSSMVILGLLWVALYDEPDTMVQEI